MKLPQRFGIFGNIYLQQNRTPLIASSRSGFPGIVKILLEKIKEFPEDEKQKYLDHEMRVSSSVLKPFAKLTFHIPYNSVCVYVCACVCAYICVILFVLLAFMDGFNGGI